MTFQESVKTCFEKYATFKGRATRSEYWYFALFNFIVSLVATAAATALDLKIIQSIVTLALFLPGLAVFARRMHDIGRSGKWYFIAFTIIGAFVLLYWAVQPSESGENQYGPAEN